MIGCFIASHRVPDISDESQATDPVLIVSIRRRVRQASVYEIRLADVLVLFCQPRAQVHSLRI